MTNETEPTAEERAMFIGKRLFPLRCNHVNQKRSFPKWLSSISGLDSVEREMIERGYTVQTTQYSNKRKPYCHICHMWNKNTATGTNKSEAILTAAYRALKSEVE